MKLDYFDLISPLPLSIKSVGSIKSPKLIDIAKISFYTYAQFINYLSMTPESYFETYKQDKVDIDTILNTTKFDLIKNDINFRAVIESAINFFFEEDFKYIPDYEAFIAIDGNDLKKSSVIGIINHQNYTQIVELILQRVHVECEKNIVDDISKVKNSRGRKIYEKILRGRKSLKKVKGNNPNLSFPNIIASVASYSNSLNWKNIWDITVYQLFDTFQRLQIIDQYNISKTSVSVWGDEKKKFKAGLWHENIYVNQNQDSV